ncbi:MAG: ATP-binding cassette domain-containing protein [Gudongella sp.]|nr:ATP-binding cassette domain-containing protein [Gudongella sp.]
MLKLENLQLTFEKGTIGEKKALKGLNLSLDKGDFVTIVGSNGAGKSTLFNAIGGRYRLDEGSICLDGVDLTGLPEHTRARDLGVLKQDPLKGTAPTLTIEENLALAYGRRSKGGIFATNRKDLKYYRELLSSLDLGLEDRMKTPVGKLSGGQRQAVTLLMCTIASPKLLLLDEHTAALDPVNARKIIEITQRIVSLKSITTLMITHDIQMALTVGNRTIMMDDGRVILDIAGDERENMTMEKLLESYRAKSSRRLIDDRMLLS